MALELLHAQERRMRRELNLTAAVALLSGAALLAVGTRVSGSERTVAYLAGGIDLGAAAAGLIARAFETPPSERLVAGEAPPAQPTGF